MALIYAWPNHSFLCLEWTLHGKPSASGELSLSTEVPDKLDSWQHGALVA